MLELEREVLGFNLTSIIGENKLKIEKNNFLSLSNLNELYLTGNNYENLLIACIINKTELKQSKSGNYFYWIHVIDDISSNKIYCSENIYKTNIHILTPPNCVLLDVSIKNDFISFKRCAMVDSLPFNKNLIFVIHIPYNIWTTSIIDFIKENIGVSIRYGNCKVFQNTRDTGLSIDPTYELINSIKNRFDIKCTIENYEDFIWGESNKLIKEMEENGY